MRLRNWCILSIFILLIKSLDNICFASNGEFNSLTIASYTQQNQQRIATLATYKKKINDSNKRIFKLKKIICRILQVQQENNQTGFNSNSKATRISDRHQDAIVTTSGSNNKSSTSDNDELEKKLSEVVVSLLDEQAKFANLILKRIIIFWNPSLNFGVDISSKGALERGFLDMLGLGDKQIWSGSNYGGKLIRATDSENRIQESVSKLISLTELYRYLMVHNYLHIIGSIYRHTKNFERTVRSRLRLFKKMRDRLVSTRDSLALILNTDLPDDVNLPHPISPPCYLNMGENCNEEMYNQILNEIAFFKAVQDENRELSTRIRDGSCGNHEVTGCTFCEIKKARISLIEWAFNDIQSDLTRLERDLKLCQETIKRNNGNDLSISKFNRGGGGFEPNLDYNISDSSETMLGYGSSELSNDQNETNSYGNFSSEFGNNARPTGNMNRRSRTCSSTEIKRYKRRSFHHKTSKKTSKRRYLKSRRTKTIRKSKDCDADPFLADNNNDGVSNVSSSHKNQIHSTDSKNSSSPSGFKSDYNNRRRSISGGGKQTTENNDLGISSPFLSTSETSSHSSDCEYESETDASSPFNGETNSITNTPEIHSSVSPKSTVSPETKRGYSSAPNDSIQSLKTEVPQSLSNTQNNKRKNRR
ncbi:putative signal peptide-containing protein [Cryptosporidium parvum]